VRCKNAADEIQNAGQIKSITIHMKSIKQIISTVKNPNWVAVVLTLILPLLFCKMVLAQVNRVAPDTSAMPDFHYEKAPCPFDATGLAPKSLECGWLTVPENRKKNNGHTIRLAVAVYTAPHSSQTPVLFLAGGPGLRTVSPEILQLWSHVFRNRSIIIFDQRGTGYSKPSLCPWAASTERYIESLNLTTREFLHMKSGYVLGCHAELVSKGIDLNAYNVIENAADVNDLRKALGYTKWNITGLSYGGMLAQAVIRDYPQGVRSAILISPAPLDEFGVALEHNVTSFARSLNLVFKHCKHQKACISAYPNLQQRFKNTMHSLQDRPLTISLDTMIAGQSPFIVNTRDFVQLVQNMLYSEHGIVSLPGVIMAFNKRDKDAIRNILTAWGHDLTGPGEGTSDGMFRSDVCYDAPQSKSNWEKLASAHPDLRSIGFLGDACSYWESAHATSAELKPVKSKIPVLVYSGDLDPFVPPRFIRQILNGLPNAKHITYPDGTHIPDIRHNCLDHLFNAFLTNPSAPLDMSCVSKLSPLTFKVTGKQ
jgi:pimeloyl-ACP methyl ester carboxylesterase